MIAEHAPVPGIVVEPGADDEFVAAARRLLDDPDLTWR